MPHDPETARALSLAHDGLTRILATIIDPEGNRIGLAGHVSP